MQQPTADGLRPAGEGKRRWTIVPMYNATEDLARLLESMWATRTPEEAYAVLSKPDVTVTNTSDKVMQLAKLSKFDQRVRDDAEVQAALLHNPQPLSAVQPTASKEIYLLYLSWPPV